MKALDFMLIWIMLFCLGVIAKTLILLGVS